MIIGIDTRISIKNKTGVDYMISNLIPELISLDNKNTFKILGDGLSLKKDNVKIYSLKGIVKKILNFSWKKFSFPKANTIIGDADKFVFTNFVDFPVKAKDKILFIPDLSYIKYPQYTEKKNLKFLKKNVGNSIKRADKIITISHSAKEDIVNYYKIEGKKVYVIYLAPSKNIRATKNITKIKIVKNKYNIKKKYILFVGTLEPRKNIESLIKAYALLEEKIKKQYDLVICGAKGWYYKNIFEQIKNSGLSENVVITGYVEENDLSCIYSGASCFVFPSFYEGFGLPILEAFKCGLPVISSNTSSLSEVGGDAALYFYPNDIKKIKENIERVLTDIVLQKKLVAKGYRQLQKFSWGKAAKKTLEILLK